MIVITDLIIERFFFLDEDLESFGKKIN